MLQDVGEAVRGLFPAENLAMLVAPRIDSSHLFWYFKENAQNSQQWESGSLHSKTDTSLSTKILKTIKSGRCSLD